MLEDQPSHRLMEHFRQSMRGVDPIFTLVGNKCDKISDQKVSREVQL